MDKEVIEILKKYLKSGVKVEDLQSELINAHCIIYKSELPPLSGQAILYIDGTPDSNYPTRILQAYRQNCDCRWSESTGEGKPISPLLKTMNEHCEERARLLDRAISILQKSAVKEK